MAGGGRGILGVLRDLEAVRGDVLAGSRGEADSVEILRGFFEELGAEVRLHSVDVILWEHEGCDVSGFECTPLPLTRGASASGILVDDLEACGDKILIHPATSFPDNMWSIYNEAVERGARGVIFYDHYPSRRRKIVLTGVKSYGHDVKARPLVPAAHLTLESGVAVLRRLVGKRVDLSYDARARASRGYNVEAILGGRSRGSLVVAAHHDRWFRGYRDDLLGVEVLLETAHMIARGRRPPEHDLGFVSFTAEELGSPGEPAWYWAHGSREYVSRGVGDPEEILAAIVIDTAHREPLRISTTSPDHALDLARGLRPGSLLEGYGHPYTDAASLWPSGIPTITIHNMRDMGHIYHTDLDVPDLSRDLPSRLSASLALWLLGAAPEKIPSKILGEEISSRATQTLGQKILSISGKIPEGYRLSRCANKISMRPLYVGSYSELYTDMTTDPLPAWTALRMAEQGLRRPVRIPGEERILYSGEDPEGEARRLRRELEETLEEILRCARS